MTQPAGTSSTQQTPTAQNPMWEAAVSRLQALIAIAVATTVLAGSIGGPVYHLFESRTKDEASITQLQFDVVKAEKRAEDQAKKDEETEAERLKEYRALSDQLGEMKTDAAGTKQEMDDVQNVVHDLDRAKWK